MKPTVSTRGFTDIVDITSSVRQACTHANVKEGVARLFVVGATAALSTIEFEPSAVADLKPPWNRSRPSTTATKPGTTVTDTPTCGPHNR